MPVSLFSKLAPSFHALLTGLKDDAALRNARFIARNFLLEERIDPLRLDSYVEELRKNEPTDLAEWNRQHCYYLRKVFVTPPGTHDYRSVTKSNAATCPQTFRGEVALLTFRGTDLDTELIRLVPVADIAFLAGRQGQENDIFALGQKVVQNPLKDTPARRDLAAILDDAYNVTNGLCDHRPLFAAFYDDFYRDELSDPSDDSWANRLRNRLGVYRLSQLDARGLPHQVFLFKYAVRDLPVHTGTKGIRPLAIPAVIDNRFSEAFCPAPLELNRGQSLNLRPDSLVEPAREVLHLFLPMRAERLIRVGLVTESVMDCLDDARRDHLIWMQLHSSRDDFASDTDNDLLS
jgi:hypothetical protein